MQNENSIINNLTKTAIEFTILDEKKREKKLLFFYDNDDTWFNSNNATDNDILSKFAGAVMEAVKSDPATILIQAHTYSLNKGFAKKMAGCFTPQVKIGSQFKSCIIHADGTIEEII